MCRKATAASSVPKRYTSNSGYSQAGIWASIRADLAYARRELTVQVCDVGKRRRAIRSKWSGNSTPGLRSRPPLESTY